MCSVYVCVPRNPDGRNVCALPHTPQPNTPLSGCMQLAHAVGHDVSFPHVWVCNVHGRTAEKSSASRSHADPVEARLNHPFALHRITCCGVAHFWHTLTHRPNACGHISHPIGNPVCPRLRDRMPQTCAHDGRPIYLWIGCDITKFGRKVLLSSPAHGALLSHACDSVYVCGENTARTHILRMTQVAFYILAHILAEQQCHPRNWRRALESFCCCCCVRIHNIIYMYIRFVILPLQHTHVAIFVCVHITKCTRFLRMIASQSHANVTHNKYVERRNSGREKKNDLCGYIKNTKNCVFAWFFFILSCKARAKEEYFASMAWHGMAWCMVWTIKWIKDICECFPFWTMIRSAHLLATLFNKRNAYDYTHVYMYTIYEYEI